MAEFTPVLPASKAIKAVKEIRVNSTVIRLPEHFGWYD
jgi:hypothetical protein